MVLTLEFYIQANYQSSIKINENLSGHVNSQKLTSIGIIGLKTFLSFDLAIPLPGIL